MLSWFKPAIPPVPAISDQTFAMVAKEPIFNPNSDEQQLFAMYRADHIACEIEQRELAGREPHPEHDAIIAEAMSYAWLAVRGGHWTLDHVKDLQTRLLGK